MIKGNSILFFLNGEFPPIPVWSLPNPLIPFHWWLSQTFVIVASRFSVIPLSRSSFPVWTHRIVTELCNMCCYTFRIFPSARLDIASGAFTLHLYFLILLGTTFFSPKCKLSPCRRRRAFSPRLKHFPCRRRSSWKYSSTRRLGTITKEYCICYESMEIPTTREFSSSWWSTWNIEKQIKIRLRMYCGLN